MTPVNFMQQQLEYVDHELNTRTKIVILHTEEYIDMNKRTFVYKYGQYSVSLNTVKREVRIFLA